MIKLLTPQDQIDLSPNSTVSQVTFFLDRAQVKRQRTVLLEAGENLVVFDNLASRIEGNSIQVAISPGEAVKSVSTTVQQNRLYFFKKEEHRELHQKITGILKEILTLLDDKTLYVLEKRLSDELSDYIRLALNDVILDGDTPVGKLDEALQYLFTLADKNSAELITISSSIKKLEEEYLLLAKKLNQIEKLDSRLQNEVSLRLSSQKKCEVTIDIVYTVRHASWSAAYDADLDRDSGTMTLTCYGELSQYSGEDWRDAKIYLSTVPSDIPLEVPDLYPVYLSGYEEKRKNELSVESEAVCETIEPEDFASEVEVPSEEEVSPGTAGETPVLLTFCIDNEATIVSGTSGYKVQIFKETLQAASYYESIPEIIESVYLKGVFENTTGFALLPGMIKVLRGGTYMGQVKMKHVAPAREFELSFGTDDDVRIRRVVKKSIYQGSKNPLQKQSFVRKIEFVISNHTMRAEKMVVKEAIFASELQEVKVTLQPESTPGLTPDKDGIVSINLELSAGPGESQTAVIAYKVEAPRDFNLAALTQSVR